MHAYGVVIFDLLVEETFHETVQTERLLYFTLNKCIGTLSPSRVFISTGLKYFTSDGLKNMYLIVDRLRFIL